MSDPSVDAASLRKAMKGLGTDETSIIQLVCRRSNAELQAIRADFRRQFNRDLIDDLKSELGGSLEDLIVGLVYAQAE